MIPVVTPAEMGEIDAAAPEPVEELIERAGAAVARAAVAMLGGTYGRRVVVIAGKGNNGNDGRAAAPAAGAPGRRRSRWSRRPRSRRRIDGADLVIDAAYGTGFRGTWDGAGHRRREGAGGRHPERGRRVDRRGRRRRAPRRPHRHVRGDEAGPAAPAGIGLRRRDRGGRHRPRCQPRPCPSGDRGPTWPLAGCRGPPTPTSGTPRWPSWPARPACRARPAWSRRRRMRTGAGYVRLSTRAGSTTPACRPRR